MRVERGDGAAPASERPRSRAAKLLLSLISVGFALGVAEVALRVAGVSYPNFYQPDAQRGWGLRPAAAGWWHSEGEAYVRINSRGQRDVEHALAKPAGTLRIAILGDSCTEALQVPVEATFWKLLEPALAACPTVAGSGKRVEALNFGVAGYGTAQELLTLRHEVWRYRPDVVLLAFYPGNDVRNNHRRLEQDPSRPYFVLRGGRLVLDSSFRSSFGYRSRRTAPARLLYAVFNDSRLLQLAKHAKGTLDGWIGAWKARRKEHGEALQELGLDNAVYSPPGDADWREAWQVTEAMVLQLQQEVRGHGARFGVVALSTPIQVNPDPAVRLAFMRRLGVTSLSYPGDRLVAFGRAHGIEVLDLAPPLAAEAERRRVFLHGFANTAPGEGHWNARGHAAATPLVAGWLCRRLLGGSRSLLPRFSGWDTIQWR